MEKDKVIHVEDLGFQTYGESKKKFNLKGLDFNFKDMTENDKGLFKNGCLLGFMVGLPLGGAVGGGSTGFITCLVIVCVIGFIIYKKGKGEKKNEKEK